MADQDWLKRIGKLAQPLVRPAVGRVFSALEQVGYKPKTRLFAPISPPAAARLTDLLLAKQYDSLRFAMSQLHPDAHWSTVESMIDHLGLRDEKDQWLARFYDWRHQLTELHSTKALIFALVRYAAELRGGRYVRKLPRSISDLIEAKVSEAEGLLPLVIERQPNNLDLQVVSLVTARVLRLPMASHHARFRTLTSIDPLHYPGHLQMLENLSARWMGEGQHDAMFSFARTAAKIAPTGSLIKSLPLWAHFERRNARYFRGHPDADAYFDRQKVIDEIKVAWEQSVVAAGFPNDLCSEALYNHFAAFFFLVSEDDLAAQALAQMQGVCHDEPWNTLALNEKERNHPGWVVDRVKTWMDAPGTT